MPTIKCNNPNHLILFISNMSGTSRPGTPEIAEYQSTLNQEVK